MSQPQQRLLARRLYRELVRWTRSLPVSSRLEGIQVEEELVVSVPDLRDALRRAFRRPSSDTSQQQQQRLQLAMNGLQSALALDVSKLKSMTVSDENDSEKRRTENVGTNAAMQSVEWLPPILVDEASRSSFTGNATEESVPESALELPFFPLSGPILPDVQQHGLLPLFSHFHTFPVAGQELQLRIFEPRYRELYHDLLSSSNNNESTEAQPRRQIVVPFHHPYSIHPQYASYAWLLDVVRVRDVADETNGNVQLLCDHVVTHQPVQIHAILNPQEATTQSTYLRVQASTLDSSSTNNPCLLETVQFEALDAMLRHRSFKANRRTTRRDLAGRLLTALQDGPHLWSAVAVYLQYLQTEILQLQLHTVSYTHLTLPTKA